MYSENQDKSNIMSSCSRRLISPFTSKGSPIILSSLVLTTPTSLVKELIDNALDAKATSIDILISRNTLDKLEVRDNGHGISPEDFGSLGKRGHTSKLRTFEELKLIGGVTLGFRGEALASATELGDVSVTTKSEGEVAATRLVFKASGAIDHSTRTSHPIGTTVSVQKFMYKTPVRKKNFEKEAPKTISKINQLLRSYFLARPSIRFSFKVIGGGKGSWSVAPRPQDGVREAISMVIGRDAAMECVEKSLVSAEPQPIIPQGAPTYRDADLSCDEDAHVEFESFAVEAFLPKAATDPSKIGTGQYLSVDSRPVSHEKGTMKTIIGLYKKYIQGTLTNSSEKVRNPFLRLNIKCPVASYDVNVEPSKDDVLFGNETVVLELVEKLLREVYGELKTVPVASSLKSQAKKLDDFDLLMARAPDMAESLLKESSRKYSAVPETCPPHEESDFPTQKPPSSSNTLHTVSPMTKEPIIAEERSATDAEDITDEQHGPAPRRTPFGISRDVTQDANDGEQRGVLNSSSRPPHLQVPNHELLDTPLNPWTISKMTTPISLPKIVSESRPRSTRPLSQTLSSSQILSDSLRDENTFTLPTTWLSQRSRDDCVPVLETADSLSCFASSMRPKLLEELFVDGEPPSTPAGRRNDFVSARNTLENSLVSPPCTVMKTQLKNRGLHTPNVSALKTTEYRAIQPDGLVQARLFGNQPRPRRRSDAGQVLLQNPVDQDLAWAMDFEHRKEDANSSSS